MPRDLLLQIAADDAFTVAHAHRMEEIRVGLKHGVDNFEHTGLSSSPASTSSTSPGQATAYTSTPRAKA